MTCIFKSSQLAAFILPLFIIIFADINGQSGCTSTPQGQAINWSNEAKLKWSDFQASKKKGDGFAVAASTCGFGYDGIQRGDEIQVSVYVRFYCRESWHNDRYNLPDVLTHEQLHFDICEVFGRKLYKGILELRNNNQLSEDNLEDLYSHLTDEYEATQNLYDKETDHSTNGEKQKEWNVAIANKLKEHSAFSNYKEF